MFFRRVSKWHLSYPRFRSRSSFWQFVLIYARCARNCLRLRSCQCQRGSFRVWSLPNKPPQLSVQQSWTRIIWGQLWHCKLAMARMRSQYSFWTTFREASARSSRSWRFPYSLPHESTQLSGWKKSCCREHATVLSMPRDQWILHSKDLLSTNSINACYWQSVESQIRAGFSGHARLVTPLIVLRNFIYFIWLSNNLFLFR